MVGVPGKYKGCNTCRARRVKCDNQRPLCRKCIDSGRDCQGYERETVFIVGTLEDKGRCSSHPPRNSKTPKTSPSPPRQTTPSPESTAQLIPVEPLRPAWDDVISLTQSGSIHQLRIAAMYMPMSAVGRSNSGGSGTTTLSLPAYTPANVQPGLGNEDFWLQAQCLTSNPPSPDGMMLYLYDHNSSLAYTGPTPWRDPLARGNKVRQLGPESFTAFPAHHFFARVYRPAAIVTGLLNRTPVFCAEPEWLATPWARHPKGAFDHLLDVLARIPALLQRLDHVLRLEATTARRLLARDLLGSCLGVEAALERWHASLHQSVYREQPAYWVASSPSSAAPATADEPQPDAPTTAAAFAGDPISFRDPLTAHMFLYYWAAQVLFYPCIGLLSHTVSAPVIDAYEQQQQQQHHQHHHSHPAAAQLHTGGDMNVPDPGAYGADRMRGIAAGVCRGLDAALAATAQPDLLAFPLQVAETFYGGVSIVAGEGDLELLWLAAFRARMMCRGRALAGAVMRRGWKDLAEWRAGPNTPLHPFFFPPGVE